MEGGSALEHPTNASIASHEATLRELQQIRARFLEVSGQRWLKHQSNASDAEKSRRNELEKEQISLKSRVMQLEDLLNKALEKDLDENDNRERNFELEMAQLRARIEESERDRERLQETLRTLEKREQERNVLEHSRLEREKQLKLLDETERENKKRDLEKEFEAKQKHWELLIQQEKDRVEEERKLTEMEKNVRELAIAKMQADAAHFEDLEKKWREEKENLEERLKEKENLRKDSNGGKCLDCDRLKARIDADQKVEKKIEKN